MLFSRLALTSQCSGWPYCTEAPSSNNNSTILPRGRSRGERQGCDCRVCTEHLDLRRVRESHLTSSASNKASLHSDRYCNKQM
jgi:hypothetical protein